MRVPLFILMLTVLMAGVVGGRAQEPVLIGIGLSGSPLIRDTLVVERDSLYLVGSFTTARDWPVRSVALNADSLDMIRVYFYADTLFDFPPTGQAVYPLSGPITQDTLQGDTLRIHFRTQLVGVVDPQVKALQVAMAVYADSGGQIRLSELHTSQAQVGTVSALRDPVDTLHVTFLHFRDAYTFPPVILAPQAHQLLARRFDVRFSQPENAARRSLYVSFGKIGGIPEPTHQMYLIDTLASSNKVFHVDALGLYDLTQVDTMSGSNALTHMAPYRLIVSYQDIYRNSAGRDIVDSITIDTRTEAPRLYEPHLGSSTTDSTVRILYQLDEPADTVWLILRADSADPFSPHILRLVPTLNGPGVVSFFLDGRNIGTDNPYVAENNNGATDGLIWQGIYSVTLMCGDTMGNDNDSTTNLGYVYPYDGRTIPGWMMQPPHLSRQSARFRVAFSLPEEPLLGSVRLRIGSTDTLGLDPGSPHMLYLHVQRSGVTDFYLDATQMAFADMVDSIQGAGTFEQNNRLVDGLPYRYAIRVYYRDSLGNPEVGSTNVLLFTFDNHTEPVRIYSPVANDTMSRTGVPFLYDKPEASLPGTFRITFAQTGGPEPDTSSPHIIFMADTSRDSARLVVIQPASLAATPGADSIHGGQALTARATYRFSVEYQDLLGNPAASADVWGLVYPSGTSVVATGRSLGTDQVLPGELRYQSFLLGLQTVGGEAVFRSVRFHVDGNIVPADITAPEAKLWSSVDTLFSESDDSVVNRLMTWDGGDMLFDSFATSLGDAPTHFFVTLSFPVSADAAHSVHLSVTRSADIDCAGDPVWAARWPLGAPDVPLPVTLTNIYTEQDTLFGALRVRWVVASEWNNEGFILKRRSEGESDFRVAASWQNDPGLVGRGTAADVGVYGFTDRGLQPGVRYIYRVAAESTTGAVTEYELEAEGIPRLPPTTYVLADAYPNPFNQIVTIPFLVPVAGQVEIRIYNLSGQLVKDLLRGLLPPSEYRANWDGRDNHGVQMPSGIYFYRMKVGGVFDQTKKVLLIR